MTKPLNINFMKQAANKVRAEGLDVLPWVVGRFYVVRRCYSFHRGILSRPQLPSGSTIFPTVNSTRAADAIRKDAVFRSVCLPAGHIVRLKEFAQSQTLTMRHGPTGFRYEDVKDGKLRDGRTVTLAQVNDIQHHPTAKSIAEDPIAIATMIKYLGYMPRTNIRMYWSFVTSASVEQRQHTGQTVQWHFDSDYYNFVFASYYLTPTDDNSGAHVMVVGSHREKPTRWLFGSVRKSDEEIESHYPQNRIVTLNGRAGEGFWQDSTCFHKALAPKYSDRLLLQIRYY